MRIALLAAALAALWPVSYASAQRQPEAAVAITDTAHLNPVSVVGGPQPVDTSLALPLGGCVASGDAMAAIGSPPTAPLIDTVDATDSCVALPTAPDGTPEVASSADGDFIYMVKGPAASTPPFDATLSDHVQGTLSTTNGLPVYGGSPLTQSRMTTNVGFSSGAPAFSFSDSASDGGGLGPPTSPYFVDQSTGSAHVYTIDHVFTQDETSLGGPNAYVWGVHAHADCDARFAWPQGGQRPAGAPSCNLESAASLVTAMPGVIFQLVPPVKATLPRSAAYLSPASAPIESVIGAPGNPSNASFSLDLGEGATGDGSASAAVPPGTELVDTTGAASHIHQAAVTANAQTTVAGEGQGAASLLYHVNLLNGATMSDYQAAGLPLSLQVPTLSVMLSATKGLDPSVIEESSFQLSIDVQGAPFFHFIALTLGSSNEYPPLLSGDLENYCTDASTPTSQACSIATALGDQALGVYPDDRDGVTLTVQTDCTTSLAHAAGAVPIADVACDASHTVTAKLISRDPNVQLLPVSEPEGAALADAGAGTVAALVARKRARRAC